MIYTHELTKKYGRRTAVDQLSFSVEEGEVVGLLGPNGAGKSSTIRMLTGYLPPTKGSATIAGFDIVKDSLKARQQIGYMPESVPLYDEMRVSEYLKFRAKLKGVKGRHLKDNLKDVLDQCGLNEMRRRIIGKLSKGYRQRVALADALIHNPKLLILDEPTNGLDPNQIRSIRELIKELAQKRTVLISTHILSEVEMICNKVVIIDQGKVKAADTPNNLINSLRSAGRVVVELREAAETVIPQFESLDQVKKVKDLGKFEGWYQYEIVVDAGTDARERIGELVKANNWGVRTIHRRQATLEDVFVELTRRD